MHIKEMSLTEINEEISSCEAEIKAAQMSLANNKVKLSRLTREKETRNPATTTIRVSDHAIVRYLERFKDVDIMSVRKEILTPEIVSAIRAGASTVHLNGAVFKVTNGVITTIMEK